MTKDDALVRLCTTLVADPGILAQEWAKVVLAGVVGETHAGMHGYAFDVGGRSRPVAPRGSEALDHLRALRDAMAAADPARSPWVACLLKIEASGRIGADFEYADAERWRVTPANLHQRVSEFGSA